MRLVVALAVLCGCATGDFDQDLETRRKINSIAGGFCTTPECHYRTQAERHHIENQQLVRMEGEANRELIASQMARPDSTPSHDWWCYQGTTPAGEPIGTCDRELDACVSMLEYAFTRGVGMASPACSRQPSVTCLAASSVLNGEREIRCTPTPEICSRFRESFEKSEAWLNVSPCVPQ